MKETRHIVDITVDGVKLSLVHDKSPTYIGEIAAEVDKRLYSVRQSNPGIDSRLAGLIVLLQLVDEQRMQDEEINYLLSKFQDQSESRTGSSLNSNLQNNNVVTPSLALGRSPLANWQATAANTPVLQRLPGEKKKK